MTDTGFHSSVVFLDAIASLECELGYELLRFYKPNCTSTYVLPVPWKLKVSITIIGKNKGEVMTQVQMLNMCIGISLQVFIE